MYPALANLIRALCTIRTPAVAVAELFDLEVVPLLEPRYNVAPTQSVPIIRLHEGSSKREFIPMRRELIPSWAKDAKIGASCINARAETVETKPTFRSAFKRRRCLVVADGYYEWQKRGKEKQPYHIHFRDSRPFGFAGL